MRNLRVATAISLTFIAVLVGGFGLVADEVIEGATTRFDTAVTLWFRLNGNLASIAGPPWLQEAVRDFTSLGSFTVLGFIVVASASYLLFVRRFHDALFLVVSVILGTMLSNVLKMIFNRERPAVEASTHVFTASFPSGHATLSAVVYLTLGVLLARSTARIALRIYFIGLAAVLTLLVGVSRIWLGMHFPTDVVAGWCLGVAWALLCWAFVDLVDHFEERSFRGAPSRVDHS
jgi:undecaprenyl-diphosphatase